MKMIAIWYWRKETEVLDSRTFKSEEEFEDWLKREKELETIEIIFKDEVIFKDAIRSE